MLTSWGYFKNWLENSKEGLLLDYSAIVLMISKGNELNV